MKKKNNSNKSKKSESLKNIMDTTLEVGKKAAEILTVATTVYTTYKGLKGNKK